MRRKPIISSLMIIMFTALTAVVNAGTTVDDFNRATLGPNWTADPEYQIVSNTLANTATSPLWSYLAVFNAVVNPTEVSFKWDLSGDIEGANSGGIAIYLSAASTSANGYFIMRRYGNIDLHPIVGGVALRDTYISSVAGTQTRPEPGDIIKVIATTDASGHHFDFYINSVFDGRVSDTGKLYGNGTTQYAGVCLYGSRNNNIDDFTVRAASLTVVSPNGGESWFAGTVHNITWTSSDFTGNVKIEYSLNNAGSWTTWSSSTPNTGSFVWTLPTTTSDLCLVRISDAADGIPSDVSNAVFHIIPETEEITLLVPNGGQNWIMNTNHDITWNATSNIAFIRIYYSLNNGGAWIQITASTPNDGSFPWTIPAQVSDQARIKVEDALDGVPADISDAVFSISSLITLQVQTASGEPGSTDNPVNISLNNQTNVRGVLFELVDTPNHLTASDVIPVGRATGFTIDSFETATGVLRVLLVSMAGAIIPVGNGPIIQVMYDVGGGATVGTSSTMVLQNVTISDANGDPLIPALVNGVFYYVKAGDVAPDPVDGIVNDLDVEKMIRFLLELDPVTPAALMSGDMNNNGSIDLYDVLTVFDLVP